MADPQDREAAGAPADRSAAGESPQVAQVHWDDSRVTRAYANQCSVSTSQEEFVLSFGVSQAAEQAQSELLVRLSQQIIMSPHIAKRFTTLLDKVLQDHESRFGTPGAARPGPAEGRPATARPAKPRLPGR